MPNQHDVYRSICRDAHDYVAEIIRNPKPTRLEPILGLLVGSHALGYATDASDIDVTVIVRQTLDDFLLQRRRPPSTLEWSAVFNGCSRPSEINVVTITDTVTQIMKGDTRLITALVLDPPIASGSSKLADELHLLARTAIHTSRAQNSTLCFLENKAKALMLRPSHCNDDTLVKLLASGLMTEYVYRAARDTRVDADVITIPAELAERCRDMRASRTLNESDVKLFIDTVVQDRAVWNELRDDEADREYDHYAEALAVAIVRDVYHI